MNPEDVGRILDEIGQRIGPAGEYAWTLAVRQVYIEGVIGSIVGSALTVGLLILSARAAREIISRYRADMSREKRDHWDRTDPFGYVMSGMAVVVFGGFAFGLAGTWALTSIQFLLNPEYHAMIRLLERVVPR